MYQVTEVFFVLDLITLKRNILKTFDFLFDFTYSIKKQELQCLTHNHQQLSVFKLDFFLIYFI